MIEHSRALCLDARDTCARAADLFATVRVTRARLRLKAITGGAGTADSEPAIRGHIRDLIDTGRLPTQPPTTIWAGSSRGGRSCSACGGVLAAGEVEYELAVDSITMFIHIHCVEVWAVAVRRPPDAG